MDHTIRNITYTFGGSNIKGFKCVEVNFLYDGMITKRYIFLKEHPKANYIQEAKRIIETELNNGQLVKKARKYHHNSSVSPLSTTLISILSVATISLATLFTYKMLQPRSGGGGGEIVDPGVVSSSEFKEALSFNNVDYLQVHSVMTTTHVGKMSSDIEISPTVYHVSRRLTEALQPGYEEYFVAKRDDGTYDKYYRANETDNYILTKDVDESEFITVESEEINILEQLHMFDLSYDAFVYNKSNSAYVASFTPKQFSSQIDETLKFENKKVVSAKQEAETETNASVVDISTYKYEEKTPTLPFTPYDISSTNDQVIISPDILRSDTEYKGKITIKKGVTDVLPDVLDDVRLVTSSVTIKDECHYKRTGSREAELTIPSKVINDNIAIYLTLVKPKSSHSINIIDGVSIDPDVYEKGAKYTGTITVNDADKLLPHDLLDVTLDATSDSIKNSCTYQVHPDRKTATFTINKEATIHDTDISIELTLEEPQKWYTYPDWWNYCSNGIDGCQATKEDIGSEKEVEVEVNGLKHKVRLIDCDKDVLSVDPSKHAHCTFEFSNVITDKDGTSSQNPWNINFYAPFTSNNHDYPTSFINQYISAENNIYSVINLLPSGLKDAIQNVDKKVACGSEYEIKTYSTKLFLLAHDEMTAHEDDVREGEGTMYKYYEDGANFNKTAVGKSENETYWLRSPATNDSQKAWEWYSVQNKFDNNGHVWLTACAVAPAFCI